MPSVFQLTDDKSAKKDRTQLVVPVTKGSMWVNREDADRTQNQLVDGTANTIATIVLLNPEGLIWTKPDDAAFARESLKPTLFDRRETCTVGLFDGSVLDVHRDASTKDFVALLTISGGETVDLEDLLPPPSLRAPDPFGKNEQVDYLAFVNEVMLPNIPAKQNCASCIFGLQRHELARCVLDTLEELFHHPMT